MKQAFRNVLAVAGLLLMIASLVWISFHQEERPPVYRASKATQPQTSKPFARSAPGTMIRNPNFH
jgi:hypothetical protein